MISPTTTFVALASSNFVMRDRITEALRSDTSIKVVAATASRHVLLRLVERSKPHAVIVEDHLGVFAARGLIEEILRLSERSSVLALVDDGEREGVARAIAAGAKGVINSDGTPAEICAAIHAVVRGIPWIGATPDNAAKKGTGIPAREATRQEKILALVQPLDESGPARLAVQLRHAAQS